MVESMKEDTHDLDVNILISLVEERPVLWDKTLESYKSKAETSGAWRDICMRLNHSFDQLSEADKNKYGKMMIKRWTNVRDRFTKYLKKVQEQSSTGSKAKTMKKYLYCDQMSFLRKNALKIDNASNLDDIKVETQVNVSTEQLSNKNVTIDTGAPPSKKRAHRKHTEAEKIVTNKLTESEDRHLNFFKGILPSLQLLRDDEVVRFQSGVLNVLQDIHKARQPVTLSSQPGYNFLGWNLHYPPPPGYVQNFNTPKPPIPISSHSTVVSSAPNDFRRSEFDRFTADESPVSSESDFSEINFGNPQ